MSNAHDYDEIWRREGPTLWRAVYSFAGGRRDIADDAVAEAFASAMDQGEGVREPIPYLFKVAFRVATAELKTMKHRNGMVERAEEHVQGELRDILDSLRQLSPGQRAAVYLHYQSDLPVREVARLMGTSPAVVKVHLMRGRRRLATLLKDDDDG